jgi:predicted enzyme related to lactoylglutathione lyase
VRITRRIVVLDAADIAAVSSFWARLLGGTVDDREDDWHNVVVDGAWTLGIQLAPHHTPPEWPAGRQQQLHLDLWVDDLAAAHEHALSVGARLLQPAADATAEEQFIVYADPAGHPFCLCWHAHDTGST